MSNHLEGFTSKSNKCHKDLLHEAQVLNCPQGGFSLNPNLDSSQITQTSPRGVGERSQRLRDEYFHGWHQQPPNEGRGERFYTCL
jgi:hypothetical protein